MCGSSRNPTRLEEILMIPHLGIQLNTHTYVKVEWIQAAPVTWIAIVQAVGEPTQTKLVVMWA
jgi:hypothetical protein